MSCLRHAGVAGALTATLLAGCATAQAPPEAELNRTIEGLRAQNAVYARQIEELENRVFILSDRLETRKVNDERAAPLPLPLPATKLARGEPVPQPEGDPAAGRPASLVDDGSVEYADAAAQTSTKRPMLRLWGSSGAPAPEPESEPARAPARPARASADDDAQVASPEAAPLALYRRSLEHLRAARHDEAVAGFRDFIKQYPNHDYADNAQYWLAECFYDRKDYGSALREFQRVVQRFPQGNKTPDALLKVGFCYLALGSMRPAREKLEEVTRAYPKHHASALAAAKLAELDHVAAATAAPAREATP
jgi:tol-pal system protein YbgF